MPKPTNMCAFGCKSSTLGYSDTSEKSASVMTSCTVSVGSRLNKAGAGAEYIVSSFLVSGALLCEMFQSSIAMR
jgi:hypothetical protein